MIKLNRKEVNFGSFPNKESYLPFEVLDIQENNLVEFIYQDNTDIINLGILKGFLDDMHSSTKLYIFNMPYSRMDRPNGSYAFSLKSICSIFNSMKFTQVTVREPHSDQTLAFLDRSFPDMWCRARMDTVLENIGYDTLFFPDFGAMKRNEVMNCAFGKKQRDFKSGDIEEYSIQGKLGKSVLIVDDLCSRGGTFVNAANQLKSRGVENVSLLVSYCEENVFTGQLFDHIEFLFVSDEIPLSNHPQIRRIK